MITSSQPHGTVSTVETAFEPTLKRRNESSGISPGQCATSRNSINVSRPWLFPAGHADTFISRRYLRFRVQIPVEVSLSRLDGSLFDSGTAVIRDLSFSGLCLDDVFLANGALLAAHFEVELRPAMGPSGMAPIAGRILRIYTSGLPSFGIEFLHPEAGAENRLRTMR